MLKIVINGADDAGALPDLSILGDDLDIAFAGDARSLAAALPGCRVLLGWDFRGAELEECWGLAHDLAWIQWCGAGVDSVLFPELAESDVVLTNARGIFDRAMAEYALALILAWAKDLPGTLEAQARTEWHYRRTARIDGTRMAVIGVGSIGRAVAKLARDVGIEVTGIGRTARSGVPVFGDVADSESMAEIVAEADWVVAVLPKTDATIDLFDEAFFRSMKTGGHFINLGRGASLDEAALCRALGAGRIAAAALDTYKSEPLPEESPLWRQPGLIVSPHMSGDYHGFEPDLITLFGENLKRFRAGEPLINVVDKRSGYVRD